MKTKEYKKGLKKALDIIKSLQRCDLEWEWMRDNDNGQYIEYSEAKNRIIEELNNP